MPVVACPIVGCTFATEDVSDAVAITTLQIHAGVVHPPTLATARPKAPPMIRPRIDSGVEPSAWTNFVRRWELFRAGSEISDDAAPRQLLECTSERLGDLVLKVDPAIGTRTIDEVLDTIRRLAVVPVAISVLRAELLQLRQAPDEQFRAFAAQVQGKSETCSFSTAFTCACGVSAPVDYTVAVTRDVLLAGVADANIRREALGTADVHIQPINSIISLIEAKEMARDALPSSSHTAMSSFKRSLRPANQHSEVPTKEVSKRLDCPVCGQLFSPFTQLRSGWNMVLHKVCKTCYMKQKNRARRNTPVRQQP